MTDPQSSPVVVRAATAEDRPVIAAFIGELHRLEAGLDHDLADPAEMTEPHLRALERWVEEADGGFLLAMIGDSIIGLAVYGVVREFGYFLKPQYHVAGRISDVFVTSDYREMGVGRRLLSEAEARLRAAGVGRVEISTLFENIEARSFYELSGYRPFTAHYCKIL